MDGRLQVWGEDPLQCCSEERVVLLVDYILFSIICLHLWSSRVLLPLKLFTVFLHELGHACAVWLTGNRVLGIEVHANQGGVTTWATTRLRCSSYFVLPAGYLGSAAWGGAILVCCARPVTTRIIAIVLIFFLFVALGYSMCGRKGTECEFTLPALCIGMSAVLFLLLWLCYFTSWPYRDLLLNKVLLLVGVMNTLFATYDIWEDCVSRTVERSDAYRYAELLGGCATPVCVGIFWLVQSLIMAVAMLLLALLLAPAEPVMETPWDFSLFSWASLVVPAALLAGAVAFRQLCSKAYGVPRTVVHRGVILNGQAGVVTRTTTVKYLPADLEAPKGGAWVFVSGGAQGLQTTGLPPLVSQPTTTVPIVSPPVRLVAPQPTSAAAAAGALVAQPVSVAPLISQEASGSSADSTAESSSDEEEKSGACCIS